MVTANTTARHPCQMTLSDLLASYLSSVEASPRYVESLRRTVKKMQANGLLEVCQLAPDPANKFLANLPLSATTRHNIRREMYTLWRYAYEQGWAEVYPSRLRRIRATPAIPQAWTVEELARLWRCANADETPVSSRVQLLRKDVLPAWVGVGYDTGLRFTDVHALTADQIRAGCVATVAHKTGKPLVRALSARTMAAVLGLLRKSPDSSLFLWCLPRRRAFLMWRSFLDGHAFRGSSKWLRRTAATQMEMRERGSASAFLQHSHPALAHRSYIDAAQLICPSGPPPIFD